MSKPYFPRRESDPPPLRVVTRRTVRFQEVDLLGIVWHGHYPGFFEDARVALGEKHGISYRDFMTNRVPTPVKRLDIDYRLPLRFNDEITIEGLLHWTEAARMNYEFVIRNAQGQVTTQGYAVQLMLDEHFNLLTVPPPFYLAFCERWRAGEWS